MCMTRTETQLGDDTALVAKRRETDIKKFGVFDLECNINKLGYRRIPYRSNILYYHSGYVLYILRYFIYYPLLGSSSHFTLFFDRPIYRNVYCLFCVDIFILVCSSVIISR